MSIIFVFSLLSTDFVRLGILYLDIQTDNGSGSELLQNRMWIRKPKFYYAQPFDRKPDPLQSLDRDPEPDHKFILIGIRISGASCDFKNDSDLSGCSISNIN